MNASNDFTMVIFGFTSNLAQLKIIPALYDLEKNKSFTKNTKIIGIGRKNLDIRDFINVALNKKTKNNVLNKLINRIEYLKEDFENDKGNLYKILKNVSGNILFYLATYPNLYSKIFKSLKNHNLHSRKNSWVRLMIEKPIGNDLKSAKKLENLLSKYFNENQIFRVDHYLGKESLRKMFRLKISPSKIERISVSIKELIGVGKRGIYYDATGALIDVGQNHLIQMLVSLIASSDKPYDRAKAISMFDTNKTKIVFGQYDGYLKEDNISKNSKTDTAFVLSTKLKLPKWSNVDIIMSSGKMLNESIKSITIYFKNGTQTIYKIEGSDAYERLILDCIKGDLTYFNSKEEIEASWKFIDKLKNDKKPIIYKKRSDFNIQTFLEYME